jgi:hypothetical protein
MVLLLACMIGLGWVPPTPPSVYSHVTPQSCVVLRDSRDRWVSACRYQGPVDSCPGSHVGVVWALQGAWELAWTWELVCLDDKEIVR